MEWREVTEVLDALDDLGVAYWVMGGWGVDLLAGEQTRRHRDLDLAVDSTGFPGALSAVEGLGYVVDIDRQPAGVELGRAVDDGADARVELHPVVFGADGNGRQEGLEGTHYDYPISDLTTGRLEGRTVPCVSAEFHRTLHQGYEWSDEDAHDMGVIEKVVAGRWEADREARDAELEEGE